MNGLDADEQCRECREEHEEVDPPGPEAIPGRTEHHATGEHPGDSGSHRTRPPRRRASAEQVDPRTTVNPGHPRRVDRADSEQDGVGDDKTEHLCSVPVTGPVAAVSTARSPAGVLELGGHLQGQAVFSATRRSYSARMASAKQVQVAFDCADPRAVAEFWKAVLGYVNPPAPPGYDSWEAFDASLPVESQGSTWVCQDPDGVGPRLFFQRVPEAKTVKNRLHLDVRVGVGLTGDERVSVLEAEAARLAALGARRVRLLLADEENEACLVMQDVEGNEFCLD